MSWFEQGVTDAQRAMINAVQFTDARLNVIFNFEVQDDNDLTSITEYVRGVRSALPERAKFAITVSGPGVMYT
jgi:hypothetical protein